MEATRSFPTRSIGGLNGRGKGLRQSTGMDTSRGLVVPIADFEDGSSCSAAPLFDGPPAGRLLVVGFNLRPLGTYM